MAKKKANSPLPALPPPFAAEELIAFPELATLPALKPHPDGCRLCENVLGKLSLQHRSSTALNSLHQSNSNPNSRPTWLQKLVSFHDQNVLRYKLVRLLIAMSWGWGYMDLAHLGRQQVEPTRFAKAGEIGLKPATYDYSTARTRTARNEIETCEMRDA
jgi:hypothetical protein